jgi:hypothetical protein
MLYTSIELLGGIGNQLFQIAVILHFVKHAKNNYKLVFLNTYELSNKFGLSRKTLWNTLLKDQFTILNEKEFNDIKFQEIIRQKDHHKFQELPYHADKNLLFNDYYQSFLYVDDSLRKHLQECIYYNKEIVEFTTNYYNKIKAFFGENTQNDDMISMHIRRTDYVYDSHYHNILPISYYQKALNIGNKNKVVIFSDDIEWCSHILPNVFKDAYNLYFVNINNADIEFLLMSMFKNNIIANSTFSLWASFLSPCENKLIIAPAKWYSYAGPKNWSEIYHKYITNII